MKPHPLRLSFLLLLAATFASAEPAIPPATRAEVAAQRAALEQSFARDKAECERQFAVSACVDELRQRRHDALAPLVRREHELAAEERRERAAAQTQRVKERELAASQGDGPRAERAASSPPVLPTPASHPVRLRNPEQAERLRRQAESKAEADAAKRREQALVREQRQQLRVAEHEAKEKARTKPLAAPLPVPAASSVRD